MVTQTSLNLLIDLLSPLARRRGKHAADNLLHKAFGKSLPMKRHSAAWDDDYLGKIVAQKYSIDFLRCVAAACHPQRLNVKSDAPAFRRYFPRLK